MIESWRAGQQQDSLGDGLGDLVRGEDTIEALGAGQFLAQTILEWRRKNLTEER